MKKLLLPFFIMTFTLSFGQKKIDFGLEVQFNQNLVKKWEIGSVYDTINRTLSMLDISGDTLDIYFTKFAMSNNFEVPVYFRYNWKNRQFIDLKLSNSFNTLTMEGISNYNDGYYRQNYGTYADFEAQAIADGFTNVDTSDYENYISAARQIWESRITSTEKFQLLSMTLNYGYRFFPHKSIKAFAAFGLTIKGKYRKVNYNYLDFSNDYVQDLSAIDGAVNKFAETSFYTNLLIGVELYRFRLSLFYQTGIGYTFPLTHVDSKIVYASPFTPFDQLHSYGFSLGVDLFSKEFGSNVYKDDLSENDDVVSKVKRKKDKWDVGIRFNRRGFNDMTTYYADSASHLSIFQSDSLLINNNGTISSAENIQMATFGDIKRIGWTGQFDVFANYYLTKRWSLEAAAGFSALTFDVETTELNATIVHDTSGNYFLQSTGTPKLRSGAYRKAFNLVNFSLLAGFKLIDRDLFDLRINYGFGITLMSHRFQGLTEQPPGINELPIYGDFEDAYWGNEEVDFKVNEGSTNLDLSSSPDDITGQFTTSYKGWISSKTTRSFYPTVKFGIDASIDRFTLGLSFEKSLNDMDGFMLKNYGSIYFSIGYKLWTR